jgi:release factor glutamine methyltransferase
VFPEVFHPGLFLSTPLLLGAIEDLELETGSLVLDLGTGTGICAISIALKGARVTATDISTIAVRCARTNVLINNLEDRVRVLEGDLFQPVEKQRFDLVIFNPPYYEGKPGEWAGYAWRGENVLHRFAEGLGPHLTPKGRALLSVSTEVDLLAVKKELQENGFETREIRKRWIPGETIYVYECRPSRSVDTSEAKPDLKLAKNDHGRKSNAYRERQSGKHFSPLQHLETKIAANQNACESSQIG